MTYNVTKVLSPTAVRIRATSGSVNWNAVGAPPVMWPAAQDSKYEATNLAVGDADSLPMDAYTWRDQAGAVPNIDPASTLVSWGLYTVFAQLPALVTDTFVVGQCYSSNLSLSGSELLNNNLGPPNSGEWIEFLIKSGTVPPSHYANWPAWLAEINNDNWSLANIILVRGGLTSVQMAFNSFRLEVTYSVAGTLNSGIVFEF